MALKAAVDLHTLDIVRDVLKAALREEDVEYMRDQVQAALDRLNELPGATYCATCGEPRPRATNVCSSCRYDAEIAREDEQEMAREQAEHGEGSWPPAILAT